MRHSCSCRNDVRSKAGRTPGLGNSLDSLPLTRQNGPKKEAGMAQAKAQTIAQEATWETTWERPKRQGPAVEILPFFLAMGFTACIIIAVTSFGA